MRLTPWLATILTTLCATAIPAQAATISFDLMGKAGAGLLPGNENATLAGTPGSGGETGAGISFDDVSNILTINIGWGSGKGFTNLTGNTIAGHIHGPTGSPAPGSFTQDASVMIGLDNLPGWDSSATNGGFSGNVTLTNTQETQLLEGRLYINAHTGTNSGGEIRGNLVPVPEPSTLGFITTATLALARRRRWTSAPGRRD